MHYLEFLEFLLELFLIADVFEEGIPLFFSFKGSTS